jgi:hypothetical protein
MALADDTMARLAERQAAERKLVRDMTRRYDRAVTAAEQARTALAGAEAERVAVLASGWRRRGGPRSASPRSLGWANGS